MCMYNKKKKNKKEENKIQNQRLKKSIKISFNV